MPSVETIRPLRVAAPGTSELKISARGPNTIFYGDNAQVSSVNKIGNLASGESLTIQTKPVWLLAEATPAVIDFEEKETLAGAAASAGTTYLRPSGGDDSKRLAELVTPDCDILLGPGTFLWNTEVVQLPRSATGIRIRGSGRGVTRIKLSATAPRAFDLNRLADYDTFENIEVSDFTVDANNIEPALKSHVVFGNLISGDWGQRVNVKHVAVRRVDTINVPTGAVSRQNISIGSRHLAEGETETKLTDITVEDCVLEGGNVGVTVLGHNSGGETVCQVFCDLIKINRVKHDTLSTPTVFRADANIQIGGGGFGGEASITSCDLYNSGDVAIEVDAMTTYYEADVTTRDAGTTGHLFRNFNKPLVPGEQLYTCVGCRHEIKNLLPPFGANNPGNGWFIGAISTPRSAFGDVHLIGCSLYSKQKTFTIGANTTKGQAVAAPVVEVRKVSIDGFTAVFDELADTSTETRQPAVIYLRSSTANAIYELNDVTVRLAGSTTNATFSPWLIQLDGTEAAFGVDGAYLESTMTGVANEQTYCLIAGFNTSNLRGNIERITANVSGGDAKPNGIFIASGTTVGGRINIRDCDFTKLAGTGSIDISCATNAIKEKVFFYNNQRHGNLLNAQAAITVTASPFDYVNRDGVEELIAVVGGKVTKVEIGRTSSSLVYTTVLGTEVAQSVWQVPNGDHLRVTYTEAPVMTKFPVT